MENPSPCISLNALSRLISESRATRIDELSIDCRGCTGCEWSGVVSLVGGGRAGSLTVSSPCCGRLKLALGREALARILGDIAYSILRVRVDAARVWRPRFETLAVKLLPCSDEDSSLLCSLGRIVESLAVDPVERIVVDGGLFTVDAELGVGDAVFVGSHALKVPASAVTRLWRVNPEANEHGLYTVRAELHPYCILLSGEWPTGEALKRVIDGVELILDDAGERSAYRSLDYGGASMEVLVHHLQGKAYLARIELWRNTEINCVGTRKGIISVLRSVEQHAETKAKQGTGKPE